VGADREPVEPGPAILLALDRGAGGPLHDQLEHALRGLIRSGRLAAGARMPSTRALASELGLSRGVVLEAYAQLTAEGYLVASQGAPTRVAGGLAAEPGPAPAASLAPRHRHDFDPHLPDLARFPREEWLRALRAASRDTPYHALGHGDPRGTPALRDELMAYLGRVRAAAPEPEHTLVCGGFAAGLTTLCRLLAARGIDRIAVEDPGRGLSTAVIEAAGMSAIPVAVDADGLRVDELAAAGCEVVVVAPAHQFPTGVVLSAERRAELLAWAEDEDALIIEDDYDSELRYDREPVGALQGLAPERVAHVGSLAQRLAPGLGLGWILSPSWLTGGLTYEQGIAAALPPALDQHALADFLGRGELDRHLRRMRLELRRRREALLAALAARLPHAEPTGIAAGVFTRIELPLRAPAENVAAAAAAAGVGVEPAGGGGLVLGYGNLPEPAIAPAVAALARAVQPYM
jgi:GntR family transcriptional regulator/MocR family aminotransferase